MQFCRTAVCTLMCIFSGVIYTYDMIYSIRSINCRGVFDSIRPVTHSDGVIVNALGLLAAVGVRVE